MSEYTPTTEEIIRSFAIPPHRVIEREPDESFADYLSRLSIEGHGYQMESEAAARRWLAAHDAEVRDEHDSEVAERLGLLLWHLTGGRLSKSTYDVPTMVAQIEDTFAREQAADVRAGVVAEEPEWEYTWQGPDWCLDIDRVWDSPQECERAPEAEWAHRENGEIVRRRKAGEWEPVPVKQGDET